MKFEASLERWHKRAISQAGAAETLGMSKRTFRRWWGRHEEAGLEKKAPRLGAHRKTRLHQPLPGMMLTSAAQPTAGSRGRRPSWTRPLPWTMRRARAAASKAWPG